MGTMTLVLVIALAGVVSILVVGATRRALVDERQSVRHYQQTLNTLRSIGDRAPSSPADHGSSRHTGHRNGNGTGTGTGTSRHASRGASRDASNGASPPGVGGSSRRVTTKLASSSIRSRVRLPHTVDVSPRPRGGSSAAAPAATPEDANLVFDDVAATRPTGSPVAPPSAPRPARTIGGRPLRTPIDAPRHASLAAVVAILVVVTVAALGAVALSSRHHSARAALPPATRPAHHSAPVASTLVPVQSSSSFAATYKVPAAPYVVQLTASGPCWVYATDATGHVLWTGTLTAGQTRAVTAQGEMKVQLGAASNVTLAASGRSVQLPSGFLSPFVATFSTG